MNRQAGPLVDVLKVKKMVSEKRNCSDVADGDNLHDGCGVVIRTKRARIEDLNSVFRSDSGNIDCHSENAKEKESLVKLELGRVVGASHIKHSKEALIHSNYGLVEASMQQYQPYGSLQTGKAISIFCDRSQSVINRCSVIPKDLASPHADGSKILRKNSDVDISSLSAKLNGGQNSKQFTSPFLGIDLNAANESNIEDFNPFYHFKKLDRVDLTDASSECASTTGSSKENMSLKMWNEMKQNGFLSLPYGGIPLPKKRGRQSKKRKENELKKKEEHANRFSKVVAPSGLLSGLNPGIINHVRNSKQVRSIIAAMVTSESFARQKNVQTSRESNDIKTDLESTHNSTDHRDSQSSYIPDLGFSKEDNVSLYCQSYEGVEHSLKLSAGTLASETVDQTSNGEILGNKETLSTLSTKGANVAVQWLDLLRQDIKGRLAALRRSRKRVLSTIQTELPYLFSKEHHNADLESITTTNTEQFSDVDANSGLHMSRWKVIFNKMDKELSDEGKHLETWLGQVTEMLGQCDRGLKSMISLETKPFNSSSDNPSLKKVGSFERESAVRAAAASIYSTCTMVHGISKENSSCF
ncbi:hypothetical protein ZOSMA_9G00380 [Zostera marina]|uniref:Uncharacterized protein n=1 Tax=Zostera marina TaxID=29655 RepID=A0A0K9NH32_ZOSMR|nr:hypothetical protein ZOSMA_9G00380 [Zostera marina]